MVATILKRVSPGYARTASELKDRELNFFHLIFSTMAKGVCLVSVSDALIAYANPKFEKLFGYDPGELNGKPFSVLYFAAEGMYSSQITKGVAEKLNHFDEAICEVRNVKKNGNSFFL